ncbi:MAG: NADH-quinone oxidoreductase subunit M [Alphaproteobacteria bacterium]|nr:MAG: NADH-quinone oxidoreductase subunit M [Alphaproteobacteria bacterium]
MSNLLSLLIFTPLIGALVTMATPSRYAKQTALILSLLPLLLCVPLFMHFNMAATGLQFTENYAWLPGFNIRYALGIDGIALPLIGLTALLIPLCLMASWHVTKNTPAFFASFLALESFVIGVFAAQDFILFYLFWEAMLIPMFLLIGLWGGENRVYASLKFFLYTFLGSVLMLVAGLWLYTTTGSFSLEVWANTTLPLGAQQLLFLAFFAAFAVKVPMWPVHTWLPDAHVQAPTAGSVILAGVLLKMGAYGFLRFCLPMFPEASAWAAPAIFTLSAIAIVYAAFVAYVQTDIKKMIAYSSVSHMGFVTLAIFSGTVTGLHGGMLVMVNHGIVSAGLFLAVGVIYERLHTRQLSQFGALARIMPAYAFVTMLLTLAAVALPGTNSFVGEFLALAGSWPSAPWHTAVATSGVVFGALYMLHLYRGMFYGNPSETVLHHQSDLKDLTLREWLTFAPLLVFIPLLGIMPSLAQNLWDVPVKAISAEYLPALQARTHPVGNVPAVNGTPLAHQHIEPSATVSTTVVSTTSPTVPNHE